MNMNSLFLTISVIFITFESILCAKNQTISEEKSPEILFCNANREIRIVSLNESLLSSTPMVYKRQTRITSRRYEPKIKRRSDHNVSNACNNDIDYDIYDNYLIWSNISSIIVAPLDKKNKNILNINSKKMLLKTNEVRRISLDWIHDLLYFIESGEIKVINVKNHRIKTISDNQQLNGNYYNAIDIVVNPIDSFIAWIRWDRRTFEYKLMKSDQTGDNSKVLVDFGFYSSESQELNPCCLTIDYETRRLYFIDPKLQTLDSVLFDGTEKTSHLQSTFFAPTNSLDIYGDYVFWSNRGQSSILSTNKAGKSSYIRTILRSEHNIDSIRILHPSKQPKANNRCRTAKCSDLCIPMAGNQYICVCDNESKKQLKNDCIESHFIVSNITSGNNVKKVVEITKVNEIIITENYAKYYPLYVFKCQSLIETKTNESIKMDWFTNDNKRLIEKLNKTPFATKNITRIKNSIELKISYPFVKVLDKFKCKTLADNKTYETSYKVIVRQIPAQPKILGHSLSFAGMSKVYLTLQIENSKVDPPIDKYRIAYRGIFNFYQQEYWLDFNAFSVNSIDKNTIYVIKLDIDYTTQDLMAFKLYAHNDVGWSYPLFN